MRRFASSRVSCGVPLWLDVASLEQLLAVALGESGARLAFYLGTSGAYRKLTVQVIADGAVVAYAKIAEHPQAKWSLEREHETLNRLAKVVALVDRVPRTLGWLRWGDARVLVLTPGPGRMGPKHLMTGHVRFLQTLQDAFVEHGPFEASLMWQRMLAGARRVDAVVPSGLSVTYRRALDHLSARLGNVTLPQSLAHRDFAPWNTRGSPQGLFVFDWETAAPGTTPLYDVFHFNAIQAALLGRPFRVPLRLEEALATLWPDGEAYAAELWLAYLTDMGLYYMEARLQRPDEGEETVCQWYRREIDAHLGGNHAVA